MPRSSERGHFHLGTRRVDYVIRTGRESGDIDARVWDADGLDIHLRSTGHPHAMLTDIAERSIRYLLARAGGRIVTHPSELGQLWLKDPPT